HDPEFAEVTRERIQRFALDNVELRYAPLTDVELSGKLWKWYDIDPNSIKESIDLLFIDGPPGHLQALSRFPALPILGEKLSPSALIILDDANRPDEQATIAAWVREFSNLSQARMVPESEAGIGLLHWHQQAVHAKHTDSSSNIRHLTTAV
ncbi:MAG: hypothetical protein KDD51_00235, partial [Bdellovibrionales bacterium]|nr:hypothetical protein [Bdellovibrionales bacterium]